MPYSRSLLFTSFNIVLCICYPKLNLSLSHTAIPFGSYVSFMCMIFNQVEEVYWFASATTVKYHNWVLETMEIYFLTILETRDLRPKWCYSCFLLRPLSLTCRWLSFPCFYMVFPLCVFVS